LRAIFRSSVTLAGVVGMHRHTSAVDGPFLGTEALAAGDLTAYQLRSRFVALHQDVYLGKDAELTPVLRAKACWLRSRRRGILAGFSAAALHGARWIDPAHPAAIIDTNRRRTAGVRVWEECIDRDEISTVDGMRLTTPARTALDLAKRYPMDVSVAAIDALAQAVELKPVDIDLLIDRYRGRRGMRRARAALELIDDGAQSPKETWLRLLLVRAGLPSPQTQIAVRDEWGYAKAYLDMGWEELKVAVEYDGDQHRTDRSQYVKDIRRLEMLERMGWIVIRVIAEDHPEDIVRRVREALAQRQLPRA
jgi:very-short-patch-repair endonuclease